MKTLICGIARNENIYVNEWCHYYLDMGFDHICLYDNNNFDDPYVGDFIDKNILDKVTIIDKREQSGDKAQLEWYRDCYDTYGKEYDWFTFLDIDEFISGIDNINEFLSQDKFKDAEQIQILWKLFGDDGYIERDMSIPVHEFFKIDNAAREPWNKLLGKILLKANMKIAENTSIKVHGMSYLLTYYPSGKRSPALHYITNYKNETVYINHYRTKTLKEFLLYKLPRKNRILHNSSVDLNYYFKVNEWTPEKQEFINNWFGRDMSDFIGHKNKTE